METSLEKISRISTRKPTSCSCNTCKSQCISAPCLGTPEDILQLIDAGHGQHIKPTIWAAGMAMGVINEPIGMFQIEQKPHGCSFFKSGLCSLHDTGLKPTEGKLSHHSITEENSDPSKQVTIQVAKEWLLKENEESILLIMKKLNFK